MTHSLNHLSTVLANLSQNSFSSQKRWHVQGQSYDIYFLCMSRSHSDS